MPRFAVLTTIVGCLLLTLVVLCALAIDLGRYPL